MELKEKLKEQFEQEKVDMEEKIASEVCTLLASYPNLLALAFVARSSNVGMCHTSK